MFDCGWGFEVGGTRGVADGTVWVSLAPLVVVVVAAVASIGTATSVVDVCVSEALDWLMDFSVLRDGETLPSLRDGRRDRRRVCVGATVEGR